MCETWRRRGGAARRALRQRTLQSDCSHRKTRPFGIPESSCGRYGLVESPQPPERNTTHSPHSIPTPSSRLFDGVLVCGVHPPALSHAPLVQLASTQVVLRVGGWKIISSFGPRRAPPSGSGSAEEREQTAHRSPAKSSLLLRLLRQIVSVFAPSSSARVMSQTSCRIYDFMIFKTNSENSESDNLTDPPSAHYALLAVR